MKFDYPEDGRQPLEMIEVLRSLESSMIGQRHGESPLKGTIFQLGHFCNGGTASVQDDSARVSHEGGVISERLFHN